MLGGYGIWKDFNIGPMKAAGERTRGGEVLWPNATPLMDTSEEQSPEGERPEDVNAGICPEIDQKDLMLVEKTLHAQRLGIDPVGYAHDVKRRTGPRKLTGD